jgi:hypothetical protein
MVASLKGRMKMKIAGLMLAVLMGSGVQADEFWLEKQYRQWSASECRRLLQDSPWAKSYIMTRAYIELIQPGPVTDRGRERNPTIEYHVQLRSALPIRQALVRLAQIRVDYDDMSPEETLGFDTEMAQVLEASFEHVVELHVTYATNVPQWDRQLDLYWRTQSTETLKNSTWLIGHAGRRAPLLQYAKVAGDSHEFLLLFPRQLEGEKLVGPEDKRLTLEFVHPDVGETSRRILLPFSTKTMLVDGAVVY